MIFKVMVFIPRPHSYDPTYLHTLNTNPAATKVPQALRRAAIKRYSLPINPFRLLTSQEANNARDILREPVASQRRSVRRHLTCVSRLSLFDPAHSADDSPAAVPPPCTSPRSGRSAGRHHGTCR